MASSALKAAFVGAVMTLGCLSSAGAAPMAPAAIPTQASSPVEHASFWARPFPYGYAYGPGQCWKRVAEETPRGTVWRRVWICPEPGGWGLGEGGHF